MLPGPTYTPGSLQLLAMCMLMAAAALTYHLLLGVAGLLSFGHALYFGAGVYGLAIILQNLDIPLLPAMGLTLLVVIVLAQVVGSISLRVSGIPFAMVTLAFAQAGSVIVGRNPDGSHRRRRGPDAAHRQPARLPGGRGQHPQPVLAGPRGARGRVHRRHRGCSPRAPATSPRRSARTNSASASWACSRTS